MSNSLEYVGSELTVFALAKNWKSYFAAKLGPFIKGDVAEPGAGLGTTTLALCNENEDFSWLCIEPDRAMARELQTRCVEGTLPSRCAVYCGTMYDIPVETTFDTVIYIDVIEHIELDKVEFESAAKHLRPGGRIVILAPAWQHLYSPFDRNIGHFRRYSRSSLTALKAPGLRVEASFYLDCVGYFASLANRLLMQNEMPTKSQILLWDGMMVRTSRVLDPLILNAIGRSVVAIWIKDHAG